MEGEEFGGKEVRPSVRSPGQLSSEECRRLQAKPARSLALSVQSGQGRKDQKGPLFEEQ